MNLNSENSETSYRYYIGRIDAKEIYLADLDKVKN